MKRRTRIPTVPKKVLFLKSKFFSGAAEEIVIQRLRKVVRKVFTASRLTAVFYYNSIVRTVNKGRLPEFSASMCTS